MSMTNVQNKYLVKTKN